MFEGVLVGKEVRCDCVMGSVTERRSVLVGRHGRVCLGRCVSRQRGDARVLGGREERRESV